VTPAEKFQLPLEIIQWELTRRCDLRCSMCFLPEEGRRDHELSFREALDLVGRFADMGVKEVHLFGGEAYLRRDFLNIVKALAHLRLSLTFTTGGLNFPVNDVVEAGEGRISRIMVSLDGLEPTHDALRGVAGSFKAGLRCLESAKRAEIPCGVTTQLNRRTLGDLEILTRLLFLAGVGLWHVQLTEPFGRAVSRFNSLLQPYELPAALDVLNRIKLTASKDRVLVKLGNNIGYGTPRCRALREDVDEVLRYTSCRQGMNYLAIQSDGRVKGCAACAGGIGPYQSNIRERDLKDIWEDTREFGWTRLWSEDLLWGFCADCPHRLTCRAGCIQTSQALFGRPGNNPYCDYRVKSLAERGLRERIIPDHSSSNSGALFRVLVEKILSPEEGR